MIKLFYDAMKYISFEKHFIRRLRIVYLKLNYNNNNKYNKLPVTRY